MLAGGLVLIVAALHAVTAPGVVMHSRTVVSAWMRGISMGDTYTVTVASAV
jgi:hypothetical protein